MPQRKSKASVGSRTGVRRGKNVGSWTAAALPRDTSGGTVLGPDVAADYIPRTRDLESLVECLLGCRRAAFCPGTALSVSLSLSLLVPQFHACVCCLARSSALTDTYTDTRAPPPRVCGFSPAILRTLIRVICVPVSVLVSEEKSEEE